MNASMVEYWKRILKDIGFGQILYLLFFSTMISVKMAGFYEGQFVFNAALIFSVILLAIKVVIDKYTIKEYILAASFIMLGGIVYLHTGEKGLLLCFAMMLGMKGVSVKKVFICGIICSGIIIVVKIFGGAFGFIPENYYASYRVGIGTEIRHTFGYAHPNTMQISALALSIMMLYLITKYTKHIVWGSLFVLVFDIYVYMYSGSRTGLLVCVIYICTNGWFYFKREVRLLEKLICYCVYPLACFASLTFPLILPDSVFALLDGRFFTFRLSIARYYYANNGVSLFGIRIANPDKIPFSLDMAYMYLLLQLGMVAFVVISILTMYCVYKAVTENKTAELAVFISITIAGIWEPFLYNSSFKNILFVLAGAVLYDQINSVNVKVLALDKREILKYTAVAITTSFLFGGLYLMISKEPNAIYVDVEMPVTSSEVKNIPLYLTSEEKDAIVESGGIVLGYTDEKKPLYEHGLEAAKKEYRNRCFSMAMLGGLLGIAGFSVWNRYSRS